MANFVYLVGDRETHECLVVDPAWDVGGILAVAASDDMAVTGALVTHYHPDHVGGSMFGHTVEGLAELMAVNPVKVVINRGDVAGVKQLTGLSDSDIRAVDGGDTVTVTGTDFSPGAITVLFNGIAAANVIVTDSTLLTCTVPPGQGQQDVDVVVMSGAHLDTLAAGYTYQTLRSLNGYGLVYMWNHMEIVVPEDAGKFFR